MKLTFYVRLVGKFLLLTFLFLILDMVTQSALGPKGIPAPTPEQMPAVYRGLVLVAAVDTLLLMVIALRSRWTGWRLMLGLAFAFFGVMGVMPQSEALWFGDALGISPDMVLSMVVQSLVTLLIFVPLAVLILGKARHQEAGDPNNRLEMPAGQWAWRLGVIAGLYLVLYFGFGFVIAWQNPNLVAMYDASSHPQMFSPQLLLPFQILRAWLWMLFSLPVIRMAKGDKWETAVLVGLLLALPMNIGLAIPNAFMPDPSVRLSHFIETASSNFVFGVLITWLLLGWRRAEGEVKARVQLA